MGKLTSNIVVACDGSGHSLQAAKMGAALAQATGQPLKFLSVFPSSSLERMILSGVMPNNIDNEVENYGREVFDAVKGVVSEGANPPEKILLKGDPAKQILEYLESNPGDHLVLGRRGHSLVRSLTLGSISEKVVRHATGPVTVVTQ